MRTTNQQLKADPAICLFTRRALRGALLEVGEALSERPSRKWDELGRDPREADVRETWVARDVDWCREALAAAQKQGNVDDVAARVRWYFRAKEEAALRGFVSASSCVSSAASRATIETAEAIAAAGRVQLEPSNASAMRRLLQEAHDAKYALGQVIRAVTDKLHLTHAAAS